MRVYQLPLHLDPLFVQLHVAISREILRPAPQVRGDLPADLGAGPPSENRDMPNSAYLAELSKPRVGLDLEGTGAFLRAAIYYPRGGGLGWHTNAVKPGWRLYVPYSVVKSPVSGTLTDEGCFMDRPGFANLFEISADWQRSWHATFAVTERWSIGVRLPANSPRVQGWIDYLEKTRSEFDTSFRL